MKKAVEKQIQKLFLKIVWYGVGSISVYVVVGGSISVYGVNQCLRCGQVSRVLQIQTGFQTSSSPV